MHFIVKYFPEITIKSAPVRRRFIAQLQRNLKSRFRWVGPDIQVIKHWDKLEIIGADNALQAGVVDVLRNTPGIANFSEVKAFPFTTIENLAEQVREVWGPLLGASSFCVRAKRRGEQGFNSMDVERVVGSVLNHACADARVDLSNPDTLIKLEIVGEECFVLLKQRPGLGGFPLGTQDHVLSLMSGGFDSTVASYLTNKRGLITHFCFFNLGGRAHELGVKEVSYYLWRKFGSDHSVKFVAVPFEAVVTEILQNIHNSQMGVVLKRMMLRVASKVADDFGIQALVTGEAVAQVSSQTLANLSVIDSVTETLVLRPLITMNKEDIIQVARNIGTEEFAASMPEYCGVISVKPTTRATRERITAEEEHFDWQVLDQAYQNRKILPIHEVASDLEEDLAIVAETHEADTAIIIDLRHPNEEEKQPLVADRATILKIPFYQLNSQFADLDTKQHYLLYCDKGVMSKLHAAHLLDAGHRNVGVYRPKE